MTQSNLERGQALLDWASSMKTDPDYSGVVPFLLNLHVRRMKEEGNRLIAEGIANGELEMSEEDKINIEKTSRFWELNSAELIRDAFGTVKCEDGENDLDGLP